MFRAPVTGAYVFSWTVVSASGHWVNVDLKKNGIFEGLAQADAINGNGSGSNTAVLELDAGDELHLEVSDTGTNDKHQIWSGGHSTFSGWLIHY